MAQAEWIPHPYLHEPLLYVSGLLPHVSEGDLARALENCVPFRPSIPRGGTDATLSGTIEFRSIDKAEKALATLQSRPIPHVSPPAYLILTPYAPHSATTLPPPAAQARIVKMLPPGFTDSAVYDLFRPYGPLASVRIQANQPENAIVEFWREEDAARAQEELHYQEVGDRNISVQIYNASGRKSDFSPTAAPFVPQGLHHHHQHPYPVPQINHPPVRQFVHGPGQQVQYAPISGPGSNSHSGLIDPCNLFIKNIDPEIDSNALFSHFRNYGSIVSARVMRDDRGQSRGFGFVSYQSPEQAARAMAATNNARLGSKNIIVRLHEPRQLRQEKLAARYSGNNHPRSSSGATSPTLSDDMNLDNASVYMPPGNTSLDGAVEKSRQLPEVRPRRNSGSYYHAALAGTLNLPMRFEELSALSPVVRREVIAGELTRRITQHPDLPNMAQADIDAAVERLAQAPLQDIVDMMHDPHLLGARVRGDASSGEASREPSREPSVDSRSQNNPTTASAPEHPSTPAAISTPARTSSPTPSLGAAVSSRLTNVAPAPLPPAASERDRFAAAVGALESDAARVESIVDLLLTLSKAERAKMLFSRDFMRSKVEEAKTILATVDATEDQPAPVPALPVTPAKKNILTSDDSPRTPALSSRGPSTVTSPEPTPATPPSNNVPLASVAKTLASLSAKEIIARAPGAGLPEPDPTVVRDNDSYVDGLASRSPANQKQAVGEKLFKIVKTFDSRAAPKVTIQLLDQEDLRSLVHLMNEYPSVLREKVAIVAAQIGTRK